MRLPSSGNWKVERGMIKITKITNTKLAISLAWIVWQKVVMHPNFQLNLCKHLNLACQYSFVLIKGKYFSFLSKQRMNTRINEVVFDQFPFFFYTLFCAVSFQYSIHVKMWLKWRETILQYVNIFWNILIILVIIQHILWLGMIHIVKE